MFERVPTVLDRSESVAIGEDTLHRNDTAMIDPQATGTAYFVGRIARFERGKQIVLVQLYKRHVDLNLGGYKDEVGIRLGTRHAVDTLAPPRLD